MRETSQQIDSDAARWAAKVDRGLSVKESAELDNWLDGDARHLGAFMRMRAIDLQSQRAKALGPGFNAAAFAPGGPADDIAVREEQAVVAPAKDAGPRLSRRKFFWSGGAALAASLALIFGFVTFPRGDDYATKIGESRVVTLADGSVMTLNTNTQVDVHYSDQERLIELKSGEALFDVAHNKRVPFIVVADGVRVRAVGTSFTVRKLPDQPLAVTVAEGTVEVTKPANAMPVRVQANNTMAITARTAAPTPVKITREEVSRETAWKEGRIAFEGESLSQAAEEFARYSDVKIVIDDPTVAREEITGLFAANDPVSFSKAVALSLGLRADVGNGEIRLRRK